jgi:hypothetical protein
MTAKDYKLHLWKEFLDKREDMDLQEREIIGEIAEIYADNTDFLFKVYEAFIENDRFMEDGEHGVGYEMDGEDCIFSLEGRECVLPKTAFHKVLASMLDLLEDTLPLGSVVELKKSAFKEYREIEDVEELQMVITYRFLGEQEGEYYFPYAGVVYPTGMAGREQVLYFTRPLVDKILHRGFQDEKEQAYVYLMKKELVIEKGRNSFGYASPDKIEQFGKQVKKERGANG